MKIRTILIALAALAVAPLAAAGDTLTLPDDDGCQTYIAWNYIELAPGQRWEAPVDLYNCTADELGYFTFYGHLASKNRVHIIDGGDNVTLHVANLLTGETFTAPRESTVQTKGKGKGKKGGGGEARIVCQERQQTSMIVAAENNGSKTVKVRFTWTRLNIP